MKPSGSLALVLALGALPLALHAQQVYRSVGPDGRTVFSDVPPAQAPAASSSSANPNAVRTAREGDGVAALPIALRQVAQRFPVTLYTRSDCQPCDTGRSLLAMRGIPYAERTVTTNEDVQALERLIGEPSLPLLAVGGQHLKGFSSTEWTQYLDAAGYPKSSVLPISWKAAPARSLATPRATASLPGADTPATAPIDQPPYEPGAAPPSPGNTRPGAAPGGTRNPAGIQF